MLSGTITGSCDNNKYTLTAEWSATQNTTANTSTITVNVYLTPPSGWNTNSSMWSCVINGTTVTSNKNANITSKTLLGSRTFTVNHNSDGTASTTISFSYSNGLSGAGTYTTHTGSGSGTITLNTISRGSSFTLNRSSVTLGSDSLTLSITRNNPTYKHKVKVIIGSSNYLVAENIDTSFTFTPSINYCNNITNSTSATATIKVETLNSSGSWLAETTKTVTFNVPSSIVPTTGIGLTAYNQTNGVNVADQTTFMIKPSNATGSYGSTIKNYSITAGSYSSSAASLTTGTFKSGTYTFSVKVTDTRGRTATATRSVTIYGYYAPTVSASAYRCSSDGTKSNNGACVAVKFSWDISNLGNTNKNAKQYSVQYKLKSSTSYTTSIEYTTLSAYAGSMTVVLPNTFSTTSSYDIKVLIKDSYSTTTSSVLRISTINALFNIEQDGIGIGKIHEQGALDISGDVYIDGLLAWTNKECSVSSSNICTTYRFQNGMQVSIVKVGGTWNVNTAWGSVYSSPLISGQSFNIAFMEAPKVMINAYNDNSTSIMVCQASKPTTSATGTVYLWKPASQTGIRTWIEYIAIGRWK